MQKVCKKSPFLMTDGGSLMALRMGTSIMLAAVNPALWHLLTSSRPSKYWPPRDG